MHTQLKSTLALVLALLICVSAFAACKPGEKDNDNSSTPTISIPDDVPSQAVIDPEKGEIEMAYGSTFADLKQDLMEEGQIADGETIYLFQADEVTEIIDETTPLENGMVVMKKNADGTVLFKYTLVIKAAITSTTVDEQGNTVVERADGTREIYNSQGEVVSTIPAPPSSNGGTAENPGTSVVPGPSPSTPDDNTSVAPPTPSDSRPSDVSVSMDPNAKVDLVIAGDNGDSALVMAIMEFKKKHSNVNLRLIPSADGAKFTLLDGLKMQLASNNAPDIVLMDSVYVAAAGYQNYLLDLQIFGSDEIQDQFIPSCWEAVKSQVEGKTAQYGLPFDCNTILQFYNKDLLDEAGVTKVPSTWNELTNALERLKALPKVTSPYALMVNYANKNYMAFQWMMWLWRMGGDVLNRNLDAAAFAEQPGIDALQMYVDMVTKYNCSKTFDEMPFFTGGTAGFTMATNNKYDITVGSSTTSIHFGVDMLPELKAGVPRYSGLGLYAYALPNKITAAGSDPAKQEAAKVKANWAYEFIKFYTTSLDYQLQYCNSTYLMPSLVAGEGQGVFQGEYWTIAYRQLRTSKFRPGVKNWDSIETYIADAVNAAVDNTKSPQEALKAASQMVNRQLR